VKASTNFVVASHVNTGTADHDAHNKWPSTKGAVMRLPKLHAEASAPDHVTPYGGLALLAALLKRIGAATEIDKRVSLLKIHKPYSESDHVLAHVANLFVGGECIEDMANLQGSEAARRLFGAIRLPDPTTGGDFLRRFDGRALHALDASIDAMHARVWKQRYGKKKREVATVDMDSTVREVYGRQKEGADFSYKGSWSYHPLLLSLAESNECLRMINRPGNAPAAGGAKEALAEVLPLLGTHFERIVVRGDSAFYDADLMNYCDENRVGFALVVPMMANLIALADALPSEQWKPFRPRQERDDAAHSQRERRPDLRTQTALRRNKRNLALAEQWCTEFQYKPTRAHRAFRLLVRKQRIVETSTQGELFERCRYRFAITNIEGTSAHEAIDQTYLRCDQENVIEQFKNGLGGLWMPTGELHSNAAFLVCARLAFNTKSWLAMTALPEECIRWDWKRFRFAFVYLAAIIVRHARAITVRLSRAHRFWRENLTALEKLRC
jgi:hypothetical protein